MSQTKKMNVVNIINFVRAVEPRDPQADLFLPVVKEAELCEKYGFDNTFLLQYDAMLRPDMQAFFLSHRDDPHMEIGFWFECVKPLVEAAGLPWRGRPGYDWDWYIVPGFLIAYTQQERMKLCDCAMTKFKEIFGQYPASVGSWMLDSFSVDYMHTKYGVRGFCICREQFGVDAYTLWGGYFNGAYYPARDNIMCPAQGENNRIDAPVFRMLGPNPIYNYGDHPFPEYKAHGCPTIEPVWEGGYTPESVDWYFDVYFNQPSLAFSYFQLGQENSFGWEDISRGLPLQLEKLDKIMRARNDVHVMKLCDTADWFKRTFRDTPAEALCADYDWRPSGMQSFWYNAKQYRCNLMARDGRLYFRDIMLYDDLYQDKWVNHVCTERVARIDALPVADGWGWRDDSHPFPGLYLGTIDTPLSAVQDAERQTLTISSGALRVTCTPDAITVTNPDRVPLTLDFSPEIPDSIGTDAGALRFSHNGFAYSLPVQGAAIKVDRAGGVATLTPTGDTVILETKR